MAYRWKEGRSPFRPRARNSSDMDLRTHFLLSTTLSALLLLAPHLMAVSVAS